MKKVLLAFAVVGTIFLSACEKDEFAQPADETSIKTDTGISCRGCRQWDIVEPDPEPISLATYDGVPSITAEASTSTSKK